MDAVAWFVVIYQAVGFFGLLLVVFSEKFSEKMTGWTDSKKGRKILYRITLTVSIFFFLLGGVGWVHISESYILLWINAAQLFAIAMKC